MTSVLTVVPTKLLTMHPSHAHSRGLAGSVDGAVSSGDAPGDGAEINNRARFLLLHERDDSLREEELAAEVNIDVAVPSIRGDLNSGDAGELSGGSGVIDEDVDTAELLTRGAQRGVD